jgi:CMP-N-acetylneuraminic acid synthetase
LGKPLIQWTIDQAKQWGGIHGDTPIAVSTDGEEYKKIALENGLFHVERPPELATDDAGKVSAIRHAWKAMELRLNETFDCIIDLDVTNPCRRTQDIETVYQMIRNLEPLTVFSVTRARRNPYFNQWPCFTSNSKPLSRQSAPTIYDLNCCIYGYSREFMLSDTQHPITEKSLPYVMPEWSFCDIDSEIDFLIVESLMEEYGNEMA